MNETNEQQQEDVFKLSEHGIPHESCREQYINSLIHQEIEMNLDIASDLVFNLLKDTDVDEDELEGLKYRFIQAKASLDCYEHAFRKLEERNEKLVKFTSRTFKEFHTGQEQEIEMKAPNWVGTKKGKANLN